jgi:hypothetical protein
MWQFLRSPHQTPKQTTLWDEAPYQTRLCVFDFSEGLVDRAAPRLSPHRERTAPRAALADDNFVGLKKTPTEL